MRDDEGPETAMCEKYNSEKRENMSIEITNEMIDRSSKEAVIKQISEHFKEKIKDGSLPPGSILPSLRGISKQLDVDSHDIRSAMDLLREEHLVKMRQGSNGGTIVLAENEWKKLAILFPETPFGHWETIYKEISYFMKAKGWAFDLLKHYGRLELMQEHLKTISNGDYAGVIMSLPMSLIQKDEAAIQSLIESGFPLVFIGSNLKAWSVDDHLFSCGYWGTKHLIDQKYKRLAFVGCRSYDGEEFIKGCREALNEAGLDDLGTGYAEDEEFAIKILNNWLNLEKRPDALFYQRSDHGQKCFHILQAKNIQIGPEMGFMALDDTMFHRYTAPGPSAVRRYPERIGKKAVDLFLELVNSPKKERLAGLENPKQVDAEFSLSPGRSTCGRRMKGQVYRVPNPIPTVQDMVDYYYPPCPPMPPGYYDGY